MEDTNHRGVGAVDGADDAAFGAAVGTDVSDFDQDLIAVHGGADLVRGDEDVAGESGFQGGAQRFGVGDDEAEAVAVHGETPGNEILVGGGLGEGIAVGVDWNELAGFDELLQALL